MVRGTSNARLRARPIDAVARFAKLCPRSRSRGLGRRSIVPAMWSMLSRLSRSRVLGSGSNAGWARARLSAARVMRARARDLVDAPVDPLPHRAGDLVRFRA
jgi:hypothetical protein